MTPDDDFPRSLRSAEVRARRREMLDLPHIAPLKEFAASLRHKSNEVEVPEFDPLDGGINAQVLFLFEKPGPMTAEQGKKTGSGFISRNNDDATAEATFNFMNQAGIDRRLTAIWNVIPWWNGAVKIKTSELRDGVSRVTDLICLLPNLRAVVMVGQKAGKAERYLKNTGLSLFTSDHPSPKVRAVHPARWKAIPSEWARVREPMDSAETK